MISYRIKDPGSRFTLSTSLLCVCVRCNTHCIMQGRVITFLHLADTLGLLSPLACGEQHKGVKQTGNLERITDRRQKTEDVSSHV